MQHEELTGKISGATMKAHLALEFKRKHRVYRKKTRQDEQDQQDET